MATLRAVLTRHRHTEQFSGILTDQYLPGPYLKREGRMGKNHAKAQNSTQITSYCKNTATNCKQATAYKSHEEPLLKA